MIELYRVDMLLPASASDPLTDFIASYPHLKKPFRVEGLFSPRAGRKLESNFVDVTHEISQIERDYFENVEEPDISFRNLSWSKDDPLKDVFLATYGRFPSETVTGTPFFAHYKYLRPNDYEVPVNGRVPDTDWNKGPIDLSRWRLGGSDFKIVSPFSLPGYYIGDATDFEDLVNFWNLTAAGLDLTFYDPRFKERFTEQRKYRAFKFGGRYTGDGLKGINLWFRAPAAPSGDMATDLHMLVGDASDFGSDARLCLVDEAIWNGLNLQVPEMFYRTVSTLAATDETVTPPRLTFPLPERPFDDESHFQLYIVSVSAGMAFYGSEHITTAAPYLPEINPFYSQEVLIRSDSVRVARGATGVITNTAADHMSISAMDVVRLTTEIFRHVEIELSLSKAGLVASRLIRQMGGLDGCKPFKIEGVRHLIETHKPDQSFSRSDAMQVIKGQPGVTPLSDYQGLYIEKRPPGSELTNSAVLDFLLDRGVFRPGLRFECPNCRLDFWMTLDAAKAKVECEYCGESVNTSRQLRDKGWAFRRSGLFGRDDNQEGGIPVALTLLQLANILMFTGGYFIPAANLKSIGAAIPLCETDFCVISEFEGRVQVVIGECKNRKPITEADIDNLMAVADAFPENRFEVFVVFAKLGIFEAEELSWIERLNRGGKRRAIVMTRRELERYNGYDEAAVEFEIDFPIVTFTDLAHATEIVHFRQLRRPISL
jgi:hypothetical protein